MIRLSLPTVGLALALASSPAAAGAQVPSSGGLSAMAGVSPDTITVGDRFLIRVAVMAPSGARVEFPRFRVIEPVEAADSLHIARDSAGRWTATYPLVAWLPSDSLVARLPFRVIAPDGRSEDRVVRVRLPVVASVLPADSALHIPRPAKAVIPVVTPPTSGSGWLLPALLLAALALVAVLRLCRPRITGRAAPPDSREAALAKLAAIEAERLTERGEIEPYYVRTSRVLRGYLAAGTRLGEELTSSELLASASLKGFSAEAVEELRQLLRIADRAKFAGARAAVDAETARGYGSALRQWIQRWPSNGGAGEREAAA